MTSCETFLSEHERSQLQRIHALHGSGPEFWNAYQALLENAGPRESDRIKATNELARFAVQLGVVETALFV